LNPVAEPFSEVEPVVTGRSPWRDAGRRLLRNRLASAGAAFLALLVLATALPWILGLSYDAQGLEVVYAPPGARIVRIYEAGDRYPVEYSSLPELPRRPDFLPGAAGAAAAGQVAGGAEVRVGSKSFRAARFLLGSDELGRDLFARILYGARLSLLVGLVATCVALVIGVTYGATAGFFGGPVDQVMMRIVDIIYALPFTIFVILLMVCFGQNIVLLFLAIGAVEWLTMARIVRGQVQSLRRMEFIEAAQVLGFSRRRIIFRHIIPNVLGPIIVYATLTIPSVMLLEAFLSFLGLGVQPPMSSLGSLIKDGADKVEEYWWLLVFPGAAFSLTLFSLNFLGDGLRDALDVRSARD
jgi:oligopeptide transport system permease protein